MDEDMFENEMTPEELFKLVLFDKKKNTKIHVELEDKDGDSIDLADMMEELVGYVKDKLDSGEENQISDQIMPLMSQALISGLSRMLGIQTTSILISNPSTRMALIYMMVISFTFYKMIQVKNLTINTIEEEVSPEEIEDIERKSKASSMASMAGLLGIDPVTALKEMVATGELTEEDLRDLVPSLTEDEDGSEE